MGNIMENINLQAWSEEANKSQGLIFDEYYQLLNQVHPESFFATWGELIKNLPPETEENKEVLTLIKSLADFLVNGLAKIEDLNNDLETVINALVLINNRRVVDGLRENLPDHKILPDGRIES